APPKIVVASGMIEIEAPAATIAMGDVVLSSKGKAKVSVKNVPMPGLGSIQGTISFDPEIIQVVGTAQGTYRVRGLGNYLVDDVTVDNDAGTIEFLLILKPGRKPLTGSGDIIEIEFVSTETVNPGDQSYLNIEIADALDATGADLIFDEVSGTARIRIIMGDVDGDGVVTRRDATLLSRWLLGRAVLTAIQKKAADVNNSCPANTNWETLAPGGCVDGTDVRWIKEAAAGLRTLSSSANLQTLSRGLTVLMLPSGGVEFRALNAERMSVQVFALSGSLVFNAETTTGVLRFEGISNRGTRLAKGVYLYIVTLYGRDGTAWRSEVRKLIVR
ncbi:MAG: dockerin type I domain-containing protein, partial [Candidatus Caldarchaeum sp.]